MELTGKCKEVFEKWFTDSDNYKGFDAEQIALDRKYRLKVFYQLYPSMQYGVYVDFFWFNKIPVAHDWIPIILKNISLEDYRIETIEKANEIYNDAH